MMMLEVLIALVIFSVGILGMVAMQSVSSANSINSEDRTIAAMLANDLIAELWAGGAPPVAPADYDTPLTGWTARVGNSLRDGVGALTTSGNTAHITITWTPNRNTASDNYAAAKYETWVTIQ
jgi:type IV pilus assembly protein PilV